MGGRGAEEVDALHCAEGGEVLKVNMIYSGTPLKGHPCIKVHFAVSQIIIMLSLRKFTSEMRTPLYTYHTQDSSAISSLGLRLG